MTSPKSTLDGWERSSFTAAGLTHDVFRKGTDGPGVLVIPEIPGATPEVLAFAGHVVAAGFRVVIPSLFGVPGKAPAVGYVTGTVLKLCVAKEFRAFASGAERPVSLFLRGLAADLAERTGGGVGVVGMCFTGGFALATAVEASVLAAVMSQPGVPFPIGARRAADIGLSPDETAAVARRTQTDLNLLGLRFSEDRACRPERFESYERAFPGKVELIELDSRKGNPDGFPTSAHSVITHEVRENPPNSAFTARDKVVAFLADALRK